MHKIVPDELIKGLKLIIVFTFLGISLLFGAIKYPYPLAIVVMVVVRVLVIVTAVVKATVKVTVTVRVIVNY